MAKKITSIKKNNAHGNVLKQERFVFRLFITGNLPNSVNAIINMTASCETYSKGRYNLEIIDIYQQPSFAVIEGIIAVPFLIKKLPLPEETMIGDLSDLQLVLKEFRIKSLV